MASWCRAGRGLSPCGWGSGYGRTPPQTHPLTSQQPHHRHQLRGPSVYSRLSPPSATRPAHGPWCPHNPAQPPPPLIPTPPTLLPTLPETGHFPAQCEPPTFPRGLLLSPSEPLSTTTCLAETPNHHPTASKNPQNTWIWIFFPLQFFFSRHSLFSLSFYSKLCKYRFFFLYNTIATVYNGDGTGVGGTSQCFPACTPLTTLSCPQAQSPSPCWGPTASGDCQSQEVHRSQLHPSALRRLGDLI